MERTNKINQSYDLKKYLFQGKEFSRFNYYKFKLKLFWRMNNNWYKTTPESDSLYRRRNRLIIIIMSVLWYLRSADSIFNRVELKVLSKNSKTVRIT
jgi:hypothetical protein